MAAQQGYTIVYHDSLGFRAAPIQLILLDAGVPFTMQAPSWSPDRVAQGLQRPVFAPPAIIQGDFVLAQTPAIMDYLGKAHGYGPGDDPKAAASQLQLLMDIGDVTSELFELHGKPKPFASKAEFAKDGGRLSNWLKHLDAFRAKAGGGSGFLCAGHPTAADFFLVSAFDALDFSLGPEATAGITPDGLKAWRALMEARPSFAAFKAQAKPALFPRMAAPKKVNAACDISDHKCRSISVQNMRMQAS